MVTSNLCRLTTLTIQESRSLDLKINASYEPLVWVKTGIKEHHCSCNNGGGDALIFKSRLSDTLIVGVTSRQKEDKFVGA